MSFLSARKMSAFRSLVFVGTALCVAATPAFAASTKQRVGALEQSVGEIQSKLAEEGSASAVRIGQLERQVQVLTGQVEELQYKLDLSTARLEAISSVLANDPAMADALAKMPTVVPPTAAAGAAGLNGVSAGGSLTGGPSSLAPSTSDPIAAQISAVDQQASTGDTAANATANETVQLPGDADAAFDFASGYLFRSDYPGAQAAFEQYLTVFPDSARAADAQFRLGEIYLATGNNTQAADAFINHIKKYPNDPRTAEAYLKLGTSFARMEKPTQACQVFKTMKKKFPDASPSITQRREVEMSRIQCS